MLTPRGTQASDPPGLWAPLRHREFRLLWAGFVVSHVGDFVQLIAQNWLVVGLTRSAFRVAVVAFAQALPRLFVSLFAGVLVDRVDRRRLLVVTQSLAALQSVLFLALVVTHRITYGSLVALAFALGLLDSLNLTARQAVMPTLVPRELIARAVALQSLGVNVTQILGPLVSALVLGLLGVAGCLALNVLSFTLLIVTLVRLELPKTEAPPPGRSFTDDLREGVGYVRSHPAVLHPIVFAYALGVLGMPLVRLLPLFSRVVLATTPQGYSLLAAASGVGALGASLLVTARASRADLPRNVVASGVTFAAALVAFAFTRAYALSWAVLVVFGASQMAFRSAVVTLLQLEVPDRMRGRVMSVLSIDFSLWSIGATAVGVVADALARAHAQLPAGVDRSLLPPDAVAWGLSRSLALHGALCLAVMLALAAPFLRAASLRKDVA